jgi:hypothetical protein
MTLAVTVIQRCRSEAEASKDDGVALRRHLGRASFEARKSSHLKGERNCAHPAMTDLEGSATKCHPVKTR